LLCLRDRTYMDDGFYRALFRVSIFSVLIILFRHNISQEDAVMDNPDELIPFPQDPSLPEESTTDVPCSTLLEAGKEGLIPPGICQIAQESEEFQSGCGCRSAQVTGPPSITEPPTEQEIGTDICACQPSSYDIVLDFDLGCDNTNVQGPGIEETACIVDPPIVEASQIQIAELDQGLEVIEESKVILTDTFLNGDKVTYKSIIADDAGSLTPSSIPGGLQISVTGVNADGTELTNAWVVLFTNDCDSFPVIESGMQIGWTIFVRIRGLVVSLIALIHR